MRSHRCPAVGALMLAVATGAAAAGPINGPIVVVQAPSNLGLRPPGPGREPGVRRLPEALLAAGIVPRLGARDGGRVPPPPYAPDVEAEHGIRNARAIRDYSRELALRVGAVLDRGGFPLVLGGDCSILLGSMLALQPRGRHGLFFLDGHTDFATPATSGTAGAAGMDLALATGRGPRLLAGLGDGPLVRDEDVVVLGVRPGIPPGAEIARTGMALRPLDRIRRDGGVQIVEAEMARLRASGVRGFWIHLDADVLDDGVMPAVDARQPGGLSFRELTDVLRVLLASDLCVGLHVTIYDPDLDPDGTIGRSFADAIVASFPGPGGGR